VLFAQRLQTGPVPLRHSGSVLDLVIAQADVFILQEVTRQSGASISAAFDGCGWIPGGGGLNRNPTPGVGRHVLNSRLAEFALYFGHFRTTDHYAIGPKGKGSSCFHARATLGRARITL